MTHTLAQKLKVTLDLIETSRLAWNNMGPSLRGVIVSCLYIIVSVLYILDHEMCFINFKSLLSDHKLFNVNQYEFSYFYLFPLLFLAALSGADKDQHSHFQTVRTL